MELLREQSADVIISDVKMPDMGGIELLRAARELQPEIEVIMMTAFANEQTAHEAFLLGAFDFVHKPFDNDLLKEKVARALQKISIVKQKSRPCKLKTKPSSKDNAPAASSATSSADRIECRPSIK